MSWLFSRALVEEYSRLDFLDGEPCAVWSETPTPPPSWLPVRTKGSSTLARSGMTFVPLTADRGRELLTLFLAASRVRMSRPPAPEKVSPESVRDCGPTSLGLWAMSNRRLYSPKILRSSRAGGSSVSSVIWPRWGMMLDGACWELATSALLIVGIGSGSLVIDEKQWPTPTVQDSKNNGAPSQHVRNMKPLNAEVGGPLSPNWVEWLMGWPIGWTDCAASATDKYQQWRRLHGASLADPNAAAQP